MNSTNIHNGMCQALFIPCSYLERVLFANSATTEVAIRLCLCPFLSVLAFESGLFCDDFKQVLP